MKKVLLIPIVCLVLHLSGNAQDIKAGITAGVAFANYDTKLGGVDASDKTRAGFTAGLMVDVPLSKNFSFQPAANFVQKGTKETETDNGSTLIASLNVNTIEVPLDFFYNAPGNAGTFFVGAGPSFTYSFSGNWKITDGTDAVTQKLKFGSTEDDDMKRFDMGANFVFGYRLKNGLMFAFNYNAGFSNLIPVSDDGSIKSYYAGLKLGFLFGGTGKK